MNDFFVLHLNALGKHCFSVCRMSALKWHFLTKVIYFPFLFLQVKVEVTSKWKEQEPQRKKFILNRTFFSLKIEMIIIMV